MYDNAYIVSGTIVLFILFRRIMIWSIVQIFAKNGGKRCQTKATSKKINDPSFKVKSQLCNGFYEVKATESGMTCDCPDFDYRGGKCKHIQATRYYLEIEKDTPQGVVTEKVQLAYKQA